MKLVFGITVSTEIEEIKQLIPLLKENKLDECEIVVLADGLTVTKEVLDYLNEEKVPHYAKNLNNDFGEFKTTLNVICKDLHEADYIFQIDADEMVDVSLIKNVKLILESNPDVDTFYIPRRNTVKGLESHEELIKEWGWVMNPKTHYINFPDYQGRIYKSHLKWVGKVHEKLNHESYGLLPTEEEFSLYHDKKLEKQIKQNNFYRTL